MADSHTKDKHHDHSKMGHDEQKNKEVSTHSDYMAHNVVTNSTHDMHAAHGMNKAGDDDIDLIGNFSFLYL